MSLFSQPLLLNPLCAFFEIQYIISFKTSLNDAHKGKTFLASFLYLSIVNYFPRRSSIMDQSNSSREMRILYLKEKEFLNQIAKCFIVFK